MVQLINPTPDTNEKDTEIKDVGVENFLEEVIEKSKAVPVLVDFWAPWCEPCKNLTPILENLAKKHADAFRLVKVNIDEQQELAMQFQVRSVPTVYLVKDAAVVDGFMGAQPENVVKEFLSKHITLTEKPPEKPNISDPIQDMINLGRESEAIEALKEDGSEESMFRLARLYLNLNKFDEVRDTLGKLKDKSTSPKYRFVEAAMHFAEISYTGKSENELREIIAQDKENWEAHYQLAAICMVSGDIAEAMELLLQIVRNDRSFNEDAGRKGLIKAFDMVGGDHPLVSQYRSSLARTLH